MPPSVSGHGGEFYLDHTNNYVPTIEFTLPSRDSKVRFNTAGFTSPNLVERVFANNSGTSTDKRHPNDHPLDKRPLTLKNNETQGFHFADETGTNNYFIVRYFEPDQPDQPDQVMEIKSKDGSASVVRFEFNAKAGYYMALIIYNVRKFDDNNSEYEKIVFDTNTGGTLDELKRPCYFYVVAAKNAPESTNPQLPEHEPKTWPDGKLTINIRELVKLMIDRDIPSEGDEETLFYAPAQQIDDSNLRFDNHRIALERIGFQDNNVSNGVTFTADSNNMETGEFPLGLYFVASGPAELSV